MAPKVNLLINLYTENSTELKSQLKTVSKNKKNPTFISHPEGGTKNNRFMTQDAVRSQQ